MPTPKRRQPTTANWGVRARPMPNAPSTPPTIPEITELRSAAIAIEDKKPPSALTGSWWSHSTVLYDNGKETESTKIESRLLLTKRGTSPKKGAFDLSFRVTDPRDSDSGSISGNYSHKNGRIFLSTIPTGDQIDLPDIILNHSNGEITIQGFHKNGRYWHCRGGIFDIIAKGSGNDIGKANQSERFVDILNELRLNYTKR